MQKRLDGSSRSKKLMPILTLQAKVLADPETEKILSDAMFCATKDCNGLCVPPDGSKRIPAG
jgi:hypothetical protein